MESPVLTTVDLSAYFGDNRVVKDVTLSIPEKRITTIMGHSGCGKTTLVRCLNRMHELVPGARVGGKVFQRGQDVYAVDPILVR
ncbi:MAG: ATP-binding cassette domain-containing protein, partial [Deltaproteobacteria bacterium]